MIIYPDIELQDGKCVNLRRGRMEDPIIFDIPPVEAARKMVASGAEWLHVVDLDGVQQGGRHNGDEAVAICKAVDIPVQVGGGIRTMAAAEWWLERGAARIVLGTAAVMDRTFLREVCSRYPDQVVVSIDARGDFVAVEGWRKTTRITALQLARDLEQCGVAAMIFNDLDMTDELPDAGFAKTTQIASSLSMPLISSGCVRRLDDVSTLKYLPNIAGVVIGHALFSGRVKLSEAIAVARQRITEAEFI